MLLALLICYLANVFKHARLPEYLFMTDKHRILITSSDLATYLVCPEAWHLKKQGNKQPRQTEQAKEVKQLRQQWFHDQEVFSQLRSYAKIIFGLLVVVAIVVFLLDDSMTSFFAATDTSTIQTENELNRTADYLGWSKFWGLPLEVIGLLLLLGVVIFIWDLFDRRSTSLAQKTGLDKSAKMVALQESSYLPSRSFSSDILGLTSTPDALLEEGGVLIPIDIKPRAKKIRDRHIIEMTAHLRLIEEETGRIPNYGILLLGEQKRQVKIKNTPERQRQLEVFLDEMHSIAQGTPALATPSFYKCQNCDVRNICAHSLVSAKS